MADREKVLHGWDRCSKCLYPSVFDQQFKDCEYTMGMYCRKDKLISETVELLKEQDEVVRCKDCKYYHKPEYGFTLGDCTYGNVWFQTKEDGFCSDAKRKDN